MTALGKSAMLLVLAALLGAGSAFINPAARNLLKDDERSDEIAPAAASWLGPRALWIDARSRVEFDKDHIEGALLLNEDDWSGLLPQVVEHWKPGMPVIVYCDSGGCQASRKVAGRLRDEAGIDTAKVLHGDWRRVRIHR